MRRIRNAFKAAASGAPDALWFAGLTAIAVGIGLIYLPAGIISAGLASCFVGYAMAGGAE